MGNHTLVHILSLQMIFSHEKYWCCNASWKHEIRGLEIHERPKEEIDWWASNLEDKHICNSRRYMAEGVCWVPYWIVLWWTRTGGIIWTIYYALSAAFVYWVDKIWSAYAPVQSHVSLKIHILFPQRWYLNLLQKVCRWTYGEKECIFRTSEFNQMMLLLSKVTNCENSRSDPGKAGWGWGMCGGCVCKSRDLLQPYQNNSLVLFSYGSIIFFSTSAIKLYKKSCLTPYRNYGILFDWRWISVHC